MSAEVVRTEASRIRQRGRIWRCHGGTSYFIGNPMQSLGACGPARSQSTSWMLKIAIERPQRVVRRGLASYGGRGGSQLVVAAEKATPVTPPCGSWRRKERPKRKSLYCTTGRKDPMLDGLRREQRVLARSTLLPRDLPYWEICSLHCNDAPGI